MKISSFKLSQKILRRRCTLKPRLIRSYSIVRVCQRVKNKLRVIEKFVYARELVFESIGMIVGNISIKRARPIDICVRNLK